jgi:hypothetical protein
LLHSQSFSGRTDTTHAGITNRVRERNIRCTRIKTFLWWQSSDSCGHRRRTEAED